MKTSENSLDHRAASPATSGNDPRAFLVLLLFNLSLIALFLIEITLVVRDCAMQKLRVIGLDLMGRYVSRQTRMRRMLIHPRSNFSF